MAWNNSKVDLGKRLHNIYLRPLPVQTTSQMSTYTWIYQGKENILNSYLFIATELNWPSYNIQQAKTQSNICYSSEGKEAYWEEGRRKEAKSRSRQEATLVIDNCKTLKSSINT